MRFFTSGIRPFVRLTLFAIPLIVCMILMRNYFPQKAISGFSQWIIAFEFVRTHTEVENVFSGLTSEILKKVDIGNKIDFAFMLFYSGFLFFFFKKAKTHYKKFWLATGQILAILAFAGDFFENMQLLHITEHYHFSGENTHLNATVQKLQCFTWLKWLALACAISVAGFVFLADKNRIKWAGLLLFVPLLSGLVAFYLHSPDWINIFTLLVSSGLAVMLVSCFWLGRNAKQA